MGIPIVNLGKHEADIIYQIDSRIKAIEEQHEKLNKESEALLYLKGKYMAGIKEVDEYERNWTGKQTGETVEQGRTEKVVDKDREENQEAGE